MLRNQIRKILGSNSEETVRLGYDAVALDLLQPLLDDYLPWSGAALRPAALCAVLNDIILNERKTIVEFGSGISTVLIARLIERYNVTLISFEDDVEWQKKIRQTHLSKAIESGAVELVHAPLTSCPQSIDGSFWYDWKIVESALRGKSVDLCVIDGPAAHESGKLMSRYPALPITRKFLNSNFAIFLDDIERPGEKLIFERWQKEIGVRGRVFLKEGGFGLIRTKDSYFPVM